MLWRIALYIVIVVSLIITAYLYISFKEILAEAERKSILKTHSYSLMLLDRRGEYLYEIPNKKGLYGYWKVEKIPKNVMLAVLFSEDLEFFQHNGVNIKSFIRGIYNRIFKKTSHWGISTIPMQVVKLEFPSPRTLRNKLIEMFSAIKLVKKYGKERILKHYLTIAPFGPNVYGIRYASEKYFRKPLEDLTLEEAVFLCSIPQNPVKFNPYRLTSLEKIIARSKRTLRLMLKKGVITEREYELAEKRLETLGPFIMDTPPETSLHFSLRIKEAIERGEIKIPPNTYKIYTSLDLEKQREVEDKVFDYMKHYKRKGALNVAVLIAKRDTGEVVVYIGSQGYFDTENKGKIDYVEVPRSVGSALKPFLYALGMIDKGYNGATVLKDINIVFSTRRGYYVPANADRAFLGPVLYRYALANSRNIPAISLLEDIGYKKAYEFFKKVGVIRDYNDNSPEYYGLGLAIGGVYVKLWDMVKAYGILANDGKAFYLTLLKQEGTNKEPKEEVIPEDVAKLIRIYLADPLARLPSFPRGGPLDYPFPVSIKTGTSVGYRDAWVMAYTDKYIFGIWTGRHDFGSMDKLTGGNSSAVLLKAIMPIFHPEEMKTKNKNLELPIPDGYVKKRICPITGKLAPEEAPFAVIEIFKEGTEPKEYSDIYRFEVVTNGIWVERRFYAVVSKEFLEWAISSGIPVNPSSSPISLEKTEENEIEILFPKDGMVIKMEEDLSTKKVLKLELKTPYYLQKLVLYINGKPYKVLDYPFDTAIELKKGYYELQVVGATAPIKSKIHRIYVK